MHGFRHLQNLDQRTHSPVLSTLWDLEGLHCGHKCSYHLVIRARAGRSEIVSEIMFSECLWPAKA